MADDGSDGGSHGKMLDICVEKFRNNDDDHKTIITKLDNLQKMLIGDLGGKGLLARIQEIEYKNRLTSSVVQIIIGVITTVITAMIIKGVV